MDHDWKQKRAAVLAGVAASDSQDIPVLKNVIPTREKVCGDWRGAIKFINSRAVVAGEADG